MSRKSNIRLLLIALSAAAFYSCKKDKVPTDVPITGNPSKWQLIPGDYKVFDTLGVFLYDMSIAHSSGIDIYGNNTDTLIYTNFDGNFDLRANQGHGSPFPNNVTIGSYTALFDSIDNRYDIFDFGTSVLYNNFRNDTIVFHFRKQNMPYWWNDGTAYFHKIEKHVAVKQP